ncbi:hypothetical protein TrLO_g8047 [Triparma laevis f. longispina]|uniref:Centrosomal protein of 162 kDa n=1 Tax=Triparma laevis f. longispina TaxID=1714387 RepID=A0A9W7CIJ5_9STRA|nr:hypothetical protein TrLO_g8047 [Triparma laevis f. longispina]
MFSAGDDNDEDDPYANMGDVSKMLKREKSGKKKKEKLERDEALKKKREELERRKSMTSEERVKSILKTAESEAEATTTKPSKSKNQTKQETSKSNDFAEYAKELEALRTGKDEDYAGVAQDESLDGLGKTDPLDGTGMVRFGSMDGANAVSMIQKNNDQEDTKDDSLQAFLEEDSESDTDREPTPNKSIVEPQPSNKFSNKDSTTPVQSTRNSVDTTMSTPPPPPPEDTESNSVMSSKASTPKGEGSQVDSVMSSSAGFNSGEFKTGEFKSQTGEFKTSKTVASSFKTSTSVASSIPTNRASQMSKTSVSSSPPPPPPTNQSLQASKSLTSQHNQLQKSVDNLYKSSEQYSRMGASAGGGLTSYDSAQLSTADTLGAAALQLEKDRSKLREQRTRLQTRELDLARAQSSFADSVRLSRDFESNPIENANIVEKLQSTVEALTREKEAMLLDLDDARSEIYDLRRQLEAEKKTEKEKGDIKEALGKAKGGDVTIPKEELEGYKKQMEQQETLITGFQKENEKLVTELRNKEDKWKREKGSILKDRESLNIKANKWKNDLASVSQSQQNMAEMRSALRSTLDAEQIVGEMREELGAVKDKLSRNQELKFEIDKLRKHKKEQMFKNEGLNADMMEHTEKDISMLKSLLKQERAIHGQEIERLGGKLRWYTQNQELVDRDAAILEEQNTLIAKLRAQLNTRGGQMEDTLTAADTVSAEHKSNANAGNVNKKWAKKVKDLEVQVKDLQEALNRRHPDSISNLIRAIGPSESTEFRSKQSNAETKRLRQEVDSVKEDSERRLRSLRQEYEKMKMGFEGQIKGLRREVNINTKDIKANGNAAVSAASAAPDNDTIEKLRAYYTKKIQDQEKKYDAQLRVAKRGNVGKETKATASGDRNVTYERVQELEAMLAKQKEMIRMMETSSNLRSSSDSQRQRDSDSKAGMLEGRARMAEKEAEAFKVKLAAAEARLDVTQKLSEEQSRVMMEKAAVRSSAEGLNNSMNMSRTQDTNLTIEVGTTGGVPPPMPMKNALHEAELKQAQVEMEVKKRDYEHKINQLQKDLLEANKNLAQFQQQLFQQSNQLQQENMGKEHEYMAQAQRLELAAQSAQMNAAMLQNQVTQLKQDNAECNRRLAAVKSNPTISQFGDLAQRLTDLERRANNRTEELEEVIRSNKESNRREAGRLQQLHAEEIEEKDRQIRFFKKQLDELMEELRSYGVGVGGGFSGGSGGLTA